MSTYPRTMPSEPQLFSAEVISSRRSSATFQRVTVTGPDLDDFNYCGLDHWFRLFFPTTPDAELVLPEVDGRSWWQPYLAIPESVRPHCSNYTVADFRPASGHGHAELDIDVVLHWDARGELCGGVAQWAATAEPGQRLALLDQGVLFDPPADATEIRIVADETGLPGVRGIAASISADTSCHIIVEVADAADVEHWELGEQTSVTWLVRSGSGELPGRLALAALQHSATPDPRAYGFVVGESSLATGGRRWLVQQGLAKERILFSGFWKNDAG